MCGRVMVYWYSNIDHYFGYQQCAQELAVVFWKLCVLRILYSLGTSDEAKKFACLCDFQYVST